MDMDCSPPGSSVHGILHRRILEWDQTWVSVLQVLYCLSHQGSPRPCQGGWKMPICSWPNAPTGLPLCGLTGKESACKKKKKKESACNAGDLGSISGLGRSPGEGKGYPFQYSGLENSMDCIVHGVSKRQT